MRVQRLGDNAHEVALYEGPGRIDLEWYFQQTTALPSSVMRYRLEPGAAEGEHLHLEGDDASCSPNSSDELYVVTGGELVVTSGEHRRLLRSGDAFYAPAGLVHGVRNESDAVAEMILVFGTPTGNPFPQSGEEAFSMDTDR